MRREETLNNIPSNYRGFKNSITYTRKRFLENNVIDHYKNGY